LRMRRSRDGSGDLLRGAAALPPQVRQERGGW